MSSPDQLTEADLLMQAALWDLTNPGEGIADTNRYLGLCSQLKWHGENRWKEYLPAAHHPDSSPSYITRLARWVGNVVGEADRKLLLEYALQIACFGREDMVALYRTAFTGPITQWVMEDAGLTLDTPDLEVRLASELNGRTWFCPVTDSMIINDFYHINLITGIRYRPEFAGLAMRDEERSKQTPPLESLANDVNQFLRNPNPDTGAPPLTRLVLLEDFVGSGTQSEKALAWAVEKLAVPVLFVPLIICAPGLTKLDKLVAKHSPRLRMHPLLILGERDLLGKHRNGNTANPHAVAIEALAKATFHQVAGGPHTDKKLPPYTPFGFKSTGASFVTHSNAPNNSLPLIHHQPANGGWHPLFPRSDRG